MNDMNTAIQENDANKIKSVRVKLKANIQYHEKLTEQLCGLSGLPEDEQKIVETEIDACTELNMDAQELIYTADEMLQEGASSDSKHDVQVQVMQTEKLQHEIEKLRIENDAARKRIDNMVSTSNPPKPVVQETRRKVKLPTIPLAKFSGDILKWPAFWDSFTSTIDEDETLAKVDKFNYLMSALEGEARDSVIGFKQTSEQYDQMVKHLKDRYDNREYIIHSHYDDLNNLARCGNKTDEIRKTFNHIEVHLRSLESMGENVENKFLVALVRRKLPDDFNLKLEETRGEGDWTMAALRKTISRLLVARERSEMCQRSENDSAEYTTEGLLGRESKIRCCFCEKSHWADECQTYKTAELRKARILGRCFICFSFKHMRRECEIKKPCFYCKSKGSHHSALCPEKFGEKKVATPVPKDDADEELRVSESGEHVVANCDPEVLMKIARIPILNAVTGKIESLTALFDTGSKRSYITERKAKLLQLQKGAKSTVNMNTFGTTNPSGMMTQQTKFRLVQKNGTVKSLKAKIVQTISGPVSKRRVDLAKYRDACKDLDMVEEPVNMDDLQLDILIGNDYYEDIIGLNKRQIDNGLYVVSSTVGWMFSGRINGPEGDSEYSMFVNEDEKDVETKLWDLDTIGVKHTNDEDKISMMEELRNRTKQVSKRYQVPWMWMLPKTELARNYTYAEARLKSLINNLQKEAGLIEKYDEIIQKHLRNGVTEDANSTEEYLQQEPVVTHYLPHHLVQSESWGIKKQRVVFEGCAKPHKSKKSLNECLYQGPNLLTNLCGELLRFRLNPIGLVADVEQAYVQLELEPSDRDVTRFLWLKDISKPVSKDNIRELRFCRVIWGIVCAAFLLAGVILIHLEKYDTPVARDIARNLYADNLLTGTVSSEESMRYYDETKKIFSDAAMNMCKWVSNDSEVMKYIKEEDRSPDVDVNVLGLIWNINRDTLAFKTPNGIIIVEVTTKRVVVKFVSSLFDPHGLVAPLLVKPKKLIQDLWKAKIGWDCEIPEDCKKIWNEIKEDLLKAEEIIIDRCINIEKGKGTQRFQLVVFADASKVAYAAVIYLKVTNEETQSVNVHLIYSKHRLSPIKENLTIPRLELMGVLIGCRMTQFIVGQIDLKLEPSIIFTDAKCVIEWTKTNKALSRFVGERVREIVGSEIQISYVKSEENPADIASRGCTVQELKNNNLWWHGPIWVKDDLKEMTSRSYELSDEEKKEFLKELKGYKVLHEMSLASASETLPLSPFGINEMGYSSHVRLIRVTAWCSRFIQNYFDLGEFTGVLTPKELTDATNMWDKFIQDIHFSEKNKLKSVTLNLGVYKDERGIMRCSGRFPSELIHPKLLPSKSHYTKLVIVRAHRALLHQGASQTLAKLRNEYWVVQGRAAVRKVIRQCLICIHWEGGPFKTPPFAPLPNYVVTANTPPFSYVGIDYLGPLFIKDNIEGSRKKNWVCLFTCLTIRAVHLELVDSMSTENFLLCVRRFIARRGTPLLIVSDNASQIILGSEIIEKIWMQATRHEDVQSFMSSNGIQWKFVTEYAPWQGGFYERLVGMTKRALRKSLGRSKVNGNELYTLLTEIEAMLNSRPLVYLNDDINSGEAITPAHFLSANIRTGIPDINDEYEPKELSWTMIVENWKKGQMKLQCFWEMWTTDYLQTLRERHTLQMKAVKGECSRSPEVGEVVLVKEDKMPRGTWKLAKVVNLIKSEIDGIARAAMLRMSNGKQFRRPFRLLYPLERRYEEMTRKEIGDSLNTDAPLSVPPSQSTSATLPSQTPIKSPQAPTLPKIDFPPPIIAGDATSDETATQKKREPRRCATIARQKIQKIRFADQEDQEEEF